MMLGNTNIKLIVIRVTTSDQRQHESRIGSLVYVQKQSQNRHYEINVVNLIVVYCSRVSQVKPTHS